jgi:bacteriocin-like protein
MSINKQVNHQRVLAYQAATTLTYEEMEQISGGNAGLYWTMHQSGIAAKVSGAEPQISLDGSWDY